jgi:hypothetical protein
MCYWHVRIREYEMDKACRRHWRNMNSTGWCKVPFQELIGPHLDKKFTARRSTTVFTTVRLTAQTDPVHIIPSYLFKILFNIILRYMPESIKRLLSGFPKQNLYALFFCAMRATYLHHFTLFEER